MRKFVLVSCFCLLAGSFVVSAQTTATVRAQLLPLLTAAQQAIAANQMPAALAKLSEARSIAALNPQESILIQRLTVAAGINDDAQYALVTSALDGLISSPLVPIDEKLSLLETSISLSQKQRNHAHTIQATEQYLKLTPAKRSVLVARAQAHYFLKQFDLAAPQIKSIVTAIKANEASPEETLLRMWADSYKQLKNSAGYETALWALINHHPKPAYFADFLNRKLEDLEPKSRYELDIYRLMRETKALSDADDFFTMAQLSIKAGFPQEALNTLLAGKTAGVLGTSGNLAQTSALQNQSNQRLAEDVNSLSKLENTSIMATDGNVAAQVGELYFASMQWEKAAHYYDKAITLGSLKREDMVRLHHAIALKQSGKLVQAKAAFAWAAFDETAKMIGDTWLLLNNKP